MSHAGDDGSFFPPMEGAGHMRRLSALNSGEERIATPQRAAPPTTPPSAAPSPRRGPSHPASPAAAAAGPVRAESPAFDCPSEDEASDASSARRMQRVPRGRPPASLMSSSVNSGRRALYRSPEALGAAEGVAMAELDGAARAPPPAHHAEDVTIVYASVAAPAGAAPSPSNTTGGRSASLVGKAATVGREYPVEEMEGAGDSAVNPLRPRGSSGSSAVNCTAKAEASAGGETGVAAGVREGETPTSSAADFDKDNSDPLFTLSRIPAPTTAAEYFARVAEIDHVRCGLGKELEGDAKDIYGPTWPFSKRMLASWVLGTKACPAPNCDHKRDIRAVTGPRLWTLLFIYGVLLIYPVFTTVAYAGEHAWQGIIPLWLLSGVTIVFVTLCAFTDPGIVPRRRLKNVKDRGDILIVRVPAPNAEAVLQKLQEQPDTLTMAPSANGMAPVYNREALRGAVADGDIPVSVFNHKRGTVYSMERYFETDTGRIVSYNPPLSESDLSAPTLEFPILFCRTCQVAKGPRTHHCKVCDNCVDEMDHHCPWTNCCIGRNNYPYFFGSLFFLHVMGLYSITYNFFQNIRFIYLHPTWDIWRLLRYVYGMPVIVYVSFFFLGFFFFPLMIGHIYMMFQGLTTAEMLKKKWKESKYFGGVNPWSQRHWYDNFRARLFKRWPAEQDDPLRWLDSRYYYGVAVAAAVEDQKVDWLIALPPEERAKVEERRAAEQAAGAKLREAQEAAIVHAAMKKRGFQVESS